MNNLAETDRFLTCTSVSEITGFGRAAIYKKVASGDFPRPIKIGRASRWSQREVGQWVEDRKAVRKAA
ncbi:MULTISPECIES: helix-turn-helix transcriptional regulator [Ruegeria]|uniref:helix-turn-helix transcriptional regulator n=1 Tax=Ruegeria TaxID=97050 RepID=UPI001F217D05|nr:MULTISPECIES: AlpA family phage regulatory protein [Ruegeria]